MSVKNVAKAAQLISYSDLPPSRQVVRKWSGPYAAISLRALLVLLFLPCNILSFFVRACFLLFCLFASSVSNNQVIFWRARGRIKLTKFHAWVPPSLQSHANAIGIYNIHSQSSLGFFLFTARTTGRSMPLISCVPKCQIVLQVYWNKYLYISLFQFFNYIFSHFIRLIFCSKLFETFFFRFLGYRRCCL